MLLCECRNSKFQPPKPPTKTDKREEEILSSRSRSQMTKRTNRNGSSNKNPFRVFSSLSLGKVSAFILPLKRVRKKTHRTFCSVCSRWGRLTLILFRKKKKSLATTSTHNNYSLRSRHSFHNLNQNMWTKIIKTVNVDCVVNFY